MPKNTERNSKSLKLSKTSSKKKTTSSQKEKGVKLLKKNAVQLANINVVSDNAPQIRVRNSRENNLQNLSVSIPRYSFTVVTGLSGAGKSSLAYNTLFKEGQRRYIASLSSYARQFFPSAEPADVDAVEGLSPTISIDQKSVSRNPRSTVGTVTKVYDFLRLWFARLGTPHCPNGHGAITSQSREVLLKNLFSQHRDEMVLILAPMVRDRKGEYRKELESFANNGFARALIDGKLHRLEDEIALGRYEKHTIEIVCDRFILQQENMVRLHEAINKAGDLSGRGFSVLRYNALRREEENSKPKYSNKEYETFNLSSTCMKCGHSAPDLEPKLFSFNSTADACKSCFGLGVRVLFNMEKVVVDETKNLFEDASPFFRDGGKLMFLKKGLPQLKRLFKHYSIAESTPFERLPDVFLQRLFNGENIENDGIALKDGTPFSVLDIFGKYITANPDGFFGKYCSKTHCKLCGGSGLSADALNVLFRGESIFGFSSLNIETLHEKFSQIKKGGISEAMQLLWAPILSELMERLHLLCEIGLGYLTIHRKANTLSGGESQRLRLASQIGSGLEECLYILDEPSIGLHPKDNAQLIETLKILRNKNNTLVVIEHDEDTMLAADYLIEIGPSAGVAGGKLLLAETPQQIVKKSPRSLQSITMDYLLGRKVIAWENFAEATKKYSASIASGNKKIVASKKNGLDKDGDSANNSLIMHGLQQFNLNEVEVSIPLQCLTVVCGVSGSGKSTFLSITEAAFAELFALRKARRDNTKFSKKELLPNKKRLLPEINWVDGHEKIEQLVFISQKPIGRTPRSNPVTYTKAWDIVRDIYASKKESKVRGYVKGRFSFNVKGGRCEECGGGGVSEIDMKMFSSVQVTCEGCSGKRFNANTLEIMHEGKNIFDVLEMNIAEAAKFFKPFSNLHKILSTLDEIGLGYLKMGQPSTSLSGGEAQRIKLGKELAKSRYGSKLYLLDEPTTGLHFADIEKLMGAIARLIAGGNTVVIIEHNLEVIKLAHRVVELGPGGGAAGGKVVFVGNPRTLATSKTATGNALSEYYAREEKREAGFFLKKKNLPSLLSVPSGIKKNKGTKIAKPTSAFHESHVVVEGLKTNNLKNVTLQIPKKQMVVFTGVSGSGKTSLLFDSIFVEGQRRYMESLSSYARRFLAQGPKVDVERMDNLSPTIAIGRENASRNPRSIVATGTEIYDDLRLLFANVGTQNCPHCYKPLNAHRPTMAAKKLLTTHAENAVLIAAPLYWQHFSGATNPPNMRFYPPRLPATNEDEAVVLLEEKVEQGFNRFLVNDEVIKLGELDVKERAKKLRRVQFFAVVVDRIAMQQQNLSRLVESIEKAYVLSSWGAGGGMVSAFSTPKKNERSSVNATLSTNKSKKTPSSFAGAKKFFKSVGVGKSKPFSTTPVDSNINELPYPAHWEMFSQYPACFQHAYIAAEKLQPRDFSFNHHDGVCEVCEGFATSRGFDAQRLVANFNKPLFNGAFLPLLSTLLELNGFNYLHLLQMALQEFAWNETTPYQHLDRNIIDVLYFGRATWPGLYALLYEVYSKRKHFTLKQQCIAQLGVLADAPCGACRAHRLKRDVSSVTFAGENISRLCRYVVQDAYSFFTKAQKSLTATQAEICKEVLADVVYRLENLLELGLGYLELSRKMFTLSGGERQRVRLSTQLGSRLSGTLYVLDEPTVGLHEHDTRKLLKVVRNLLKLDNSVMMIEHAAPMIEAADFIVDVGPLAGERGGEIVYCGVNNPAAMRSTSFYSYMYANSVAKSAPVIQQKKQPAVKKVVSSSKHFSYERVAASDFNPLTNRSMFFRDVFNNNLKGVAFYLPCYRLIGISGVSGSGKSSLLRWLVQHYESIQESTRSTRLEENNIPSEDIFSYYDENVTSSGDERSKTERKQSQSRSTSLLKSDQQLCNSGGFGFEFPKYGAPVATSKAMRQVFRRMVVIDQSPLSSNSRSVIATSIGIYDLLRDVFTATKLAKQNGFDKGFFSFNSRKGQCRHCAGLGEIAVEMHFVADVVLPCDVCKGKRFKPEVLEVHYRGKNISDVLGMTATEASEFFFGFQKIVNALSYLLQVGLGYLKMGFAVKLLSSGERQRLKIADQLAFGNPADTLYLLDEPTTGLHFADVVKLLQSLDGLIAKKATVVVVEHNIEFLRSVDYLIDLGPVGGDDGGFVLAQGSIKEVKENLTNRAKKIKKKSRKKAKASKISVNIAKEYLDGDDGDIHGATYKYL